MRAKLVNEAIKHLTPRSEKELQKSWEKTSDFDLFAMKFYEDSNDAFHEIERRGLLPKYKRFHRRLMRYAKHHLWDDNDATEYIKDALDESIKHLTPKSEEEVKNSLASSKVAFYHIDTDEFEYKGKRRTYTSSSNVVSFLRTKDYLVSVKKGKPLGFARADLISSWINSGYGSIYQKANVYDWENKTFLKYLCTGKYPVNEAIKHLTPREFDTNSNLMRALEEFDEARQNNPHSLLKENRDNIIIIMETLTELGFLVFFKYTWVVSAFSIHLDDIEHQYTKEFSGFYIPIDAYKKDYPDPYVAMAYKTGLELTERISTGSVYARNNGVYLHPTLDMEEVKKFVLQFKK